MTFPEVNAVLRSDEIFLTQWDEDQNWNILNCSCWYLHGLLFAFRMLRLCISLFGCHAVPSPAIFDNGFSEMSPDAYHHLM